MKNVHKMLTDRGNWNLGLQLMCDLLSLKVVFVFLLLSVKNLISIKRRKPSRDARSFSEQAHPSCPSPGRTHLAS